MNDKQLLDLLTQQHIDVSKGYTRRLKVLINVQGRIKKVSRAHRRSLQPKTTHIPTESFKEAIEPLKQEFEARFNELLKYIGRE